MLTECPACQAQVEVPDVTPGLVRVEVRCTTCRRVFSVDLDAAAEAAAAPRLGTRAEHLDALGVAPRIRATPSLSFGPMLGDLDRAKLLNGEYGEEAAPEVLTQGAFDPALKAAAPKVETAEEAAASWISGRHDIIAWEEGATPPAAQALDLGNMQGVAGLDLGLPDMADPDAYREQAARARLLGSLDHGVPDSPLRSGRRDAIDPSAPQTVDIAGDIPASGTPFGHRRTDDRLRAVPAPDPDVAAGIPAPAPVITPLAESSMVPLERSHRNTKDTYRRDGTFLGRMVTWTIGLAVLACVLGVGYAAFVTVAELTGHAEYTTLADDAERTWRTEVTPRASEVGESVKEALDNPKDTAEAIASKATERVRGSYVERVETRPDGTKVRVWVPRDTSDKPAKGRGAKGARGRAAKKPAATGAGRGRGKRPPTFAFKSLDGGPTLTAARIKGKTVIVNFYATWCPPCREEIPDFSRFHRDAQAKGDKVEVVGVVFQSGSPTAAAAASRKLGADYPLYAGTQADARAWGLRGFPTTVVIAPNGRIHERMVGGLNYAQLRGLAKAAEARR